MTTVRRIVRLVSHCLALMFCAFWLVATSSQDAPPIDCFTGITNPTRLTVSLGSVAQQPDAGTTSDASAPESCAGIDGLAGDGTLTLSLKQATPPQDVIGCYQYSTTAIQGISDTTLSTTTSDSSPAFPSALTVATGTYSSTSPSSTGCRGAWTLVLEPTPAPAMGTVISPLDAGSGQRWIVTRTIDIEQAQFCGATFSRTGSLVCQDSFLVAGITEQAP